MIEGEIMVRKPVKHEALPRHERYIYGEGEIELNKGRRKTSLTIRNTGDRAVQICSHYHFFEVNRAISFDRDAAFGAAPEDRRGVPPQPPYGAPHQQQPSQQPPYPPGQSQPGPGANTRIAGLEAELEQLRRTMGHRPPDQGR